MNKHLLVVDDEAPIRDLLSTFFQKREYQVSVAENAEETWDILKQEKIDLVILDLALGDDRDGMDLLIQIKEENPDVRVIILTGMGFDEDLLNEAMKYGASGYVSKTLPLDQLHEEISRALEPEEK